MKKTVGLFIFIFLMLLNLKIVNAGIKENCELNTTSNNKLLKRCTLVYEADVDTNVSTIKIDVTKNNVNILDFDVNITNDNWRLHKTSNDYFEIHSKKLTIPKGNYTIATIEILHEKIDSATNCNIYLVISYDYSRFCEYNNNLKVWYGLDGDEVSETVYRQECLPHSCEKVGDKYYDTYGDEVDESEYKLSCFKCMIDGNKYYDKTGTLTDETTYNEQCGENYCKQIGETFYDDNGKAVTEAEYRLKCFSCTFKDNKYYNKLGEEVEKVVYEQQCKSHKCEKVGDKYYDNAGKEVTEINFKLLCYKCKMQGDKYYDLTGSETTKIIYQQQCEKNICKKVGDKYYDNTGKEVKESEYNELCLEKTTPKCVKIEDKYYDNDGKEITEEVYKINCLKETPKCKIVDNKYYNKDGKEVSEKDYKKACFSCRKATDDDENYYDEDGNVITKEKYAAICEKIDSPKTSVMGGLIPLFSGIILIIIYNILNKRSLITRV